MANSILSKLDVLGLPISLEGAWEMAENAGRAAGKAIHEVGTITLETGKQVSGEKFSINGFLTFKEPREQAKTPELMAQETAARNEFIRKQDFNTTLEAGLRQAQNSAHTSEIDVLTAQIASMGTEERNKLYGVQENLDEKYTDTAHALASIRNKLRELSNLNEGREQDASLAETNPAGKTAMQGAFEGASGSQGGGNANLSFQATG